MSGPNAKKTCAEIVVDYARSHPEWSPLLKYYDAKVTTIGDGKLRYTYRDGSVLDVTFSLVNPALLPAEKQAAYAAKRAERRAETGILIDRVGETSSTTTA